MENGKERAGHVGRRAYVVESYAPGPADASLSALVAQARLVASAALAAEGTPVRLLRSLLVPEDEVCFFVFEGVSAEAVWEVSRRAGLRAERVAEAVEVPH